MSLPYTLRTRTELRVSEPELLLARARLIAAGADTPVPETETDAVRVVVTEVDLADLLADTAEYGLATTASVTVLTAESAADGLSAQGGKRHSLKSC
ncbi:hypothetical protein DVA86_31960 [Streptomyces armeniacus]|uniref:Uncharacterized protein n=1 Tax=Streptomyces armeniacus TaxID=83291 RepID=A0A345XXY9_9ACTN|nr:hypothetical protein [Streptomyces armeniacus]AXK36505.1 hypothetical protein DVA86_31955 [Streptomyces armeniacus]AXK36506.1 hypothetical protein DVA86_31960 [Streptomyces armeniacus]